MSLWGPGFHRAGIYPVLDFTEMHVDILQDFHTIWPPCGVGQLDVRINSEHIDEYLHWFDPKK